MAILGNVSTSRPSSKFLLTAVWILFLIPSYISATKRYTLKDGLVQHVSPSLTTKGDAFIYCCRELKRATAYKGNKCSILSGKNVVRNQ